MDSVDSVALEIQQNFFQEDENDLSNLAPQKKNYDLKRDLLPKLEVLQVRTDIAIAEIIRERLK